MNIGSKIPHAEWKAKRDNWDPDYEAAAYDRGYYERAERNYLKALPAFADWICGFNPRAVADMGCGSGCFSASLLGRVPHVLGLDIGVGAGYALPPENFRRVDLTRPLFEQVPPFSADVVVCLEVYEHIPAHLEDALIDNLLAPRPAYLILSVAEPRQWGRHHYNCRGVQYVVNQMRGRGYWADEEAAAPLRAMKGLASFYKKNTNVFRPG